MMENKNVLQERRELFESACDKMLFSGRERAGIGTLGEKTLHAVIKWYLDPTGECHEKKVHSYYADVLCADQIFEIQTRNFDKLRPKLKSFLNEYRVEIVYPIPCSKWISWIDPGTGEITKKRKSPKIGSPYEIFTELYKIKFDLLSDHLSLRILLIDIDEYRYLNGWSDDRKKGSSRCERIPGGLADEIRIRTIRDYIRLIPDGLPENFTCKDYQAASKISLKSSRVAVHVLNHIGLIEKIGKAGRALTYQVIRPSICNNHDDNVGEDCRAAHASRTDYDDGNDFPSALS